MQKFDVQMALEKLAEANREWEKAARSYRQSAGAIMERLLHEAAANFMSIEEVAKLSGYTTKSVRLQMRSAGLDPKKNRTLLADSAASALSENAELLGIKPNEMDLMSPLAYLPMGNQLKQQLITDKTVSKVTEFPETCSSDCPHCRDEDYL